MVLVRRVVVAYKHGEVTEQIIGAFYEVYNRLGYGFLEKVYENALAIEVAERGLAVVQQQPITVGYRGRVVGEYFADLLVEGRVVVELKAAARILEQHEAQLLNYLKATPYEVGLLCNFGPKAGVRRRVYDNGKKPNLVGEEWDTNLR